MRFGILILLSVCLFEQAKADAINSYVFRFSDTPETVGLEDPLSPDSEWIQEDRIFLLRSSIDFAQDPVAASVPAGGTFSVVDHMFSTSVGVGVLVHPRVQLGVTVPFHYVKLSEDYASGFVDSSTWTLGDVQFQTKIRFTQDDFPVHLAFMPFVHVPTGNATYLISDDGFRGGIRLLAQKTLGRFRTFAHVGFSYASNAQFLSIQQKSLLDMGFGIFYKINSRFGANAEWLQQVSLDEIQAGQNPTQINLGLRTTFGPLHWFNGFGLQGLEFSETRKPYMFYSGIKIPLGRASGLCPPDEDLDAILNQKPTSNSSEEKTEVQSEEKPQDWIDEVERVVVYFKKNQSTIQAAHKEDLKGVAEKLASNGAEVKYIILIGHTDPAGEADYNKDLSKRRAEAVRTFLVAQGIDETKILVEGYGEKFLKSEQEYPLNRRVEIQVIE